MNAMSYNLEDLMFLAYLAPHVSASNRKQMVACPSHIM